MLRELEIEAGEIKEDTGYYRHEPLDVTVHGMRVGAYKSRHHFKHVNVLGADFLRYEMHAVVELDVGRLSCKLDKGPF